MARAGHDVVYHGPPPAEEGNVAQVWARGGSVPLFIAADIALAAIFPAQPPTFNLQWGIRGGLFVVFWEREDAAFVHGNVLWVGDTLVIFARVNPL